MMQSLTHVSYYYSDFFLEMQITCNLFDTPKKLDSSEHVARGQFPNVHCMCE